MAFKLDSCFSFPTKLFVCTTLCLALGIGSGIVAGSAVTDWYQNLNKPFFQPPPWVFGPAWTVLYTLMGLAVARVWHAQVDVSLKSKALSLFIAQFLLNLTWSPVFFAMHQPALALGIIILLWIIIFKTIQVFRQIDNLAGYLLMPYILWVTFATMLNASIVYLN